MRLIIQVRGHIHIALYWTRAHIGVSTPTARGNDPADKLAPAGGAFLGGVLPLVTTRIIPPGGAAWKNSQCSSCSSYRNSAMPPFSSILSAFYCYPDSSLLVSFSGQPLGPAQAASVVSSFCYRVSSARICVLPVCSALLFMGMWWENGSWLRVQSVLGAALGALYSVTDLATRYILLGLVRVIHTYSPPFLVMNIYV